MHFKAPDIGLDLGTCNTVVYVKNEGIVISEPTLVISRRGDKKPIAVGEDAQRMYGRTSDAEIAIHPIRNGMIANYDATVLLLRAFISKAVGESNLVKPRLVMSIPSEIDEVNRKALTAAVRACGLKKVYLIEKPLAAAIGAGLSVFEPEGCMVVDVGGGTTEVAVVSLGGLVVSQSIPVGGVKMDEAIINHIKHEFKMLIGTAGVRRGSRAMPGDSDRYQVGLGAHAAGAGIRYHEERHLSHRPRRAAVCVGSVHRQ